MIRLTPQDFAVADKFLQCGVHLNKGTEHEFVQYTMMNGGLDLSDPAVIESLHNLYWAFCIQVRGNWDAPDTITMSGHEYDNYQERKRQGW